MGDAPLLPCCSPLPCPLLWGGTETEPLIALIETDPTDPVPSAPVGWISAIREGFSGISGSKKFRELNFRLAKQSVEFAFPRRSVGTR